MKKISLSLLAVTCSLFVYSQNEFLVEAFGEAGIAKPDLFVGHKTSCSALQPDGKIIAGGLVADGVYYDLMIVRYSANGGIDAGFGVNGMIILEDEVDEKVNDIIVQPDGKILIAGTRGVENEGEFLVMRLNEDGSFDSDFGDNGIVLVDFFNDEDICQNILLQADGKIVLCGEVEGPGPGKIGIARLDTTGALDPTFNSTGQFTYTYENSSMLETSFVLQSDGKIVASANRSLSGEVVFIRVNEDGNLDESFGENGSIILEPAEHLVILSIDLNENDEIFGAGYVSHSNGIPYYYHMAMIKVSAQGIPDPSFGDNGLIIAASSNNWNLAYDIAIQSSGGIIVGGMSTNYEESPWGGEWLFGDLAVMSYTENGFLDEDFGNAGIIEIDIDYNDQGFSLLLPDDGNILLTGFSFGEGGNQSCTIKCSAQSSLMAKEIPEKAMEISIYPSPAKEVLHIRMEDDKKMKQLDLIDLTGKTVKQVVTMSDLVTIDLGDLSPGVYFLRARTKEEITTRSFMISSD